MHMLIMQGLHASEDDEIARELRALQDEHRQLSDWNRRKRQKLFTEATKRMAYQDYRQIMEEIDKNIEHYYSRRFVPSFFSLFLQKCSNKHSDD